MSRRLLYCGLVEAEHGQTANEWEKDAPYYRRWKLAGPHFS